MIANMIIVGLATFNEEKRADRLLENEFVIYNGRIGIIKDVHFMENDIDKGDVKVTIDVTHKSGTKSPIAHTDTVSTVVSRTTIFNTVQVVTKS